MIRIHFTADDLARVRLLTGWGPLGETCFSLARSFGRNRRQVLTPRSPQGHRSTVALAHPYAPLLGSGALDLLTLTGPTDSIEEGLAALLEVRPQHLRAEITAAATTAGWPQARLRRLMGEVDPAGNRDDRRQLVRFLHAHHRHAVAPHWSRIHARVKAEHSALTRVLSKDGVDGLLTWLAPFARWRSPVLEVEHCGVLTDIRLDGRGLLLVPSVLQAGPAVWLNGVDEQAPVVLFLPLARSTADLAAVLSEPSAAPRLGALVNLLGRTRAHVLDTIGDGPCTTRELAHRLAVSSASASEHATVLRDAGLIATTRQGRAVQHRLTLLGERLLRGADEQNREVRAGPR
ncbi:ArsR/SmtB family transcription factor [Micromonospora eburnea]|uniref:Helix-turn-helix domain-containing protein n=1 Tax=Micromonospora eburnea TaxID=227316 RepID=A0A1C6UYX8_9ACTN|nr:Helix-turn-helix domain-containing protein [Micromonospora eburnea]